jgi:A/G-specific adenine glycosylase
MFQKLANWSLGEFSELPWRKNRSLYRTLVSEIMLQQTTVSTVLKHFERFMDAYPTPNLFAKATEEELLVAWKGLGYYRRARNLKKACITICEKYNGEIPLDFDVLITIHGIGIYTANAILAMGADQRALALDANLERVISRIYGIKVPKGLKLQKEIAKRFNNNEVCNEIDFIGARVFNESLMDLGRNYCQARKASCEICFLNKECFAFKNKVTDQFPVVVEKSKESFELILLRVIVKVDGKYLTYKKTSSQWLAGQNEVPTFVISSNDNEFNQYPVIGGDFSLLPSFKSAITKYKITNIVIWVNEKEATEIGLDLNEYKYSNTNLSTGSQKAIDI